MGRVSATEPGRAHTRRQRRLFGCQDLFSKELETRSSHCRGERTGPRACPCFLLAPRPPLAGGGGQGSRRQWSAAVRCLYPGAGLLRQAQDCLDKRLGAAWLTVCPWGPDAWGVPTGMTWPEWGRGSARFIPGPHWPPRRLSPGHVLRCFTHRTCREQTSVFPEVQKQTSLVSQLRWLQFHRSACFK